MRFGFLSKSANTSTASELARFRLSAASTFTLRVVGVPVRGSMNVVLRVLWSVKYRRPFGETHSSQPLGKAAVVGTCSCAEDGVLLVILLVWELLGSESEIG